jgi:hypothetical protein
MKVKHGQIHVNNKVLFELKGVLSSPGSGFACSAATAGVASKDALSTLGFAVALAATAVARFWPKLNFALGFC